MLLKPLSRYILLLVSAMALSVTTFVFGGLPMMAMRRNFGRLPYWAGLTLASGCLATAVSSWYGIMTFSVAVMIGVYAEIEDHGGSVFTSGLVAILAGIGTAAFGAGLWLNRTGGHLVTEARGIIEPVLARVTAMDSANRFGDLDITSVLQQISSGIVIAYLVALAIALVADARKVAVVSPAPAPKPLLTTFRVPDLLIWVAIVTIFGAFFRHGNELVEIISVNILNVLIVLFFFQGLAVITHLFRAYKVGPVWQALWYVLLVMQLFLFVSLFGFADFWMEFREKLTRKLSDKKRFLN